MVESHFTYGGFALVGEDGGRAEFGYPQEDGVECTHEELEGAHRKWCWYDVEIFLVEDLRLFVRLHFSGEIGRNVVR